MHRHSARLMRVAGGALVVTAITPWLGGVALAGSSKPAPPAGDARAVSHSGNVTTCDAAGFPNDLQVGADSAVGASASGFTVVVESNKQYLDITAVPDGMQIDATIVKGGDGYNVYPGTALTALHAPLVGNPPKNVPTISHWFLCASQAPTPPEETPPSVTFNDTCQGIDVSFTAGTGGTDFSVTPPESGTVTVHVDTTSTQSYPADASHPTISVTWPDNEVPASHDWVEPDNCSSTPQPVTDPAVSFANACATGITVTLTNMKVDDTTTDPVTFTVVSPNGKTHHVTVRADQIVRLAYKVKEDTTGTVTVTAPGLSKTTHSYAKNCTTVLGEKVVRSPKTPKVKAEQAQLPFTGMPAGLATIIAVLMLTVGAALSVAGRRRADEGSAS